MASWGKRKRILAAPLCVAAIGLGLWAPALGAEPAEEAVGAVRSALASARGKPPGERAAALEQLVERIEQEISKAGDAQGRSRLLELKYRSQISLAKHAEAKQTFARYARQLKDWPKRAEARSALLGFIRGRHQSGAAEEVIAAAEAALESWADDAELAPGLLHHKAWSLTRLNGRIKEAVPVLEAIIREYPDSGWRPQSMRLLANLQANGSAGGHGAALATLRLMEQQYAGTWWEHYAHMKPAMIFEARQGNPQAALQRYEATMGKFRDHKYATFCRREIKRLRKVIEEQLIHDALDDLAKGAADECDRATTMIVRAEAAGQEHVSLVGRAK